MVFYIASRACISVPASLVTRRAELSSKSNTVAGALSPKIEGHLGGKLALKVKVRAHSFWTEKRVQPSYSDALFFRFKSLQRFPDERKRLIPPRAKSRRKMTKKCTFSFPFVLTFCGVWYCF